VIVSERRQPINFVFEVADARIRHLWAVRNSDKLQLWNIASLEEPARSKIDSWQAPGTSQQMED
jgi:hypothetical protein